MRIRCVSAFIINNNEIEEKKGAFVETKSDQVE